MSQYNVLIADDSEAMRILLSRFFEKWGYTVTECSNGNEALRLLETNYYQLAVIDWIMPGISGDDLCQYIRKLPQEKYTYILMITSKNEMNDVIKGLESGADDYLVKPFETAELLARVNAGRRILDYQQLLRDRDWEIRMSCYNALTELAETRDLEKAGHMPCIAEISELIARTAGCDEDFCSSIKLYAPLHDIGKVGIPDGILARINRLSTEEYEVAKLHTLIGWQILKEKPAFGFAAEIAHSHHERWDGKGYPDGLVGEEIPLSGRIVSLVDTYNALRSVVSFRGAFSHEESVDWIIHSSGTLFDPSLVDVFVYLQHDIETIFNKYQFKPKIDDQQIIGNVI